MKLSTDKIILTGLLVLSLAEGLTHYGQVYPDSPGYMATAHFFQGKATMQAAGFRLLRPVVPFLASLVNYFLDIRDSFAVVNLVIWCATAILMFYFSKLLTKDDFTALFSSAVFTTAIPLLLFGDAVLTDMAGYFFILLGTFLVIKWDLPRATFQRVCIAGLMLAVGILSRENVASVLSFALAWTILSRGSFRRTIILIGISIGIPLLWSLAVGVSYAAWYSQGGLVFAAGHQQIGPVTKALRLLGSVQYAFGRYPEILVLAALGLLAIKDTGYLKTHVSIWVGALAVILAWPIVDTRFTFILFPSIFPLAGAGMRSAYSIIRESPLVSDRWTSLRENKKFWFAFVVFVIVGYVLITNVVLRRYFSFPWNPYTDPSVRPADIY